LYGSCFRSQWISAGQDTGAGAGCGRGQGDGHAAVSGGRCGEVDPGGDVGCEPGGGSVGGCGDGTGWVAGRAGVTISELSMKGDSAGC